MTCNVVEEFLSLFKTHGLNQRTAARGKEILAGLSPRCCLRIAMTHWVDRTLRIHCRLGIGQTPLPVSTDALESLFGKFKSVIQRSPKADFNRLVLLIPSLCGPGLDENSVLKALQSVSHKDLKQWQKENLARTQIQKRREFQRQNKVPDPGAPLSA